MNFTNTFYCPHINELEEQRRPIVEKLRADFYYLISGKASDDEVEEYITELINQPCY